MSNGKTADATFCSGKSHAPFHAGFWALELCAGRTCPTKYAAKAVGGARLGAGGALANGVDGVIVLADDAIGACTRGDAVLFCGQDIAIGNLRTFLI
jgi:hypothetical protein